MSDELCLALVIWVLFGAAVGFYLGEARGHGHAGALFGATLGLLGWAIILVLPDHRFRCPECRGYIPSSAKICMHCRSQFWATPMAHPPRLPSEKLKPDPARNLEPVSPGFARVICRECDQPIEVPETMRGVPLVCPTCQQEIPAW